MSDDHHEFEEHACPLWIICAVFGALLVLTVITVAARYVELGDLNLPLAMAIAVVKASLVLAFFMHLWWDNKFNTIAIVSSIVFLILFIGLSILDTDVNKNLVEEYNINNPLPPIEIEHAPAEGGAEAAH
ncbi:MAG: cytochrome C oxidase subunit IV family protein [Planctomycetota bacterium]|jgi:cytochrome c oxidase subunit 4